MATKMKMVMKGGKSVPAFAADGKGKMQMGGSTKKMNEGGSSTGFNARTGKQGVTAKTAGEVDRSNTNTTPGEILMKKGGAKKPKMMTGGAKPKAMYGASMKPTMKKVGSTKKK